MAGGSTLVVKIGANIDALKAALALGQADLIKTAAGASALAKSLDGQKLQQSALQMAVAIKAVGGATTLTAAEAKKADAAFQAWFEKAAKTGAEVSPELKKIADETKRVADEAKKLDDGKGMFGSLVAGVASGQLLASAFEKVGEVAVEMALKVGAALVGIVEHAMDVGGKLFDMSLKTGGTVETLSGLRYVAAQTGIEFDKFNTLLFKLQQNLGLMGEKGKATQTSLARLGLDMQKLKDMTPDEAFIKIMEALKQLPNRADQAAIGAKLFGKGFKDMAQLTQESIEGLMQEARDLGIIMSTEMAAAADAATDAMSRFRAQAEAITFKIGAAFMPAVLGLASNLSVILKDAVDSTNRSLDAMGKNGGFISTVARAMGTGEEAIKAQVRLYEYLRDALIGVVRYGIEPLVYGFYFLASEIAHVKVDIETLAVTLLSLKTVYLMVKAAGLELLKYQPGGIGHWKEIEAEIAATKVQIAESDKAVAKHAIALATALTAERAWGTGATAAVDQIEAALVKLENTHTDATAAINANIKMSRNAFGGLGQEIDTESDKKLKSLTESAAEFVTTLDTLQKQGASPEVVFAALGSEAESMRAKFAELALEVPAATQVAVDAVKKIGLSIKLGEWMQTNRAEVRKQLEQIAKDVEALAAKQREAVNKAFLGNLTVASKANTDATAAAAKAIDDRIAFVKKEMEQVELGYTKGRDSFKHLQEQLLQLEMDRYNASLRIIDDDINGRKAGLDKQASNYKIALDALSRLDTAKKDEALRVWKDRLDGYEKQTKTFLQRASGWVTSLGSVFENINSKIGQTMQIVGNAFKIIGDNGKSMGDRMSAGFAAAAAITQQYAAGTVLAAVATGALSGATAGAAVATLAHIGATTALGAAFMGVGAAVGAFIGALSALRAEQAAVNATNETALKSFEALRKEMMLLVGTTDDLRALSEAVGDVTDNGQNLADVMDYLDKYPGFSGTQRLEYFAEAWARFKKQQADLLNTILVGTKLASQQLLDYMAVAAKSSGELATTAKQYYLSQLGNAATGLTVLFNGLQAAATALGARMIGSGADLAGVFLETQVQATGLGAAIAGTFGEMMKRGASFAEALAAIKGPLDILRRQLQATGLQGGEAFDRLSAMGNIASGKITGPLSEALTGATQALQGLHNAGILNQEMFSGLAGTATEAYRQIIAQGGDGDTALQMMRPTLQTMWELQQKFGYEVDDATQAMIDEAEAVGDVGAAHMSAADQTAAAMERVVVVLEAIAVGLGVTLPAAASTGSKKIQKELDAIDPTIPEPWADWADPPEVVIPYRFDGTTPPLFDPEMWRDRGGYGGYSGGSFEYGGEQAGGGDYLVSRPTMFLAGEAGPERATFTPASTQKPEVAPLAEGPVTFEFNISTINSDGVRDLVETTLIPKFVEALRGNRRSSRTNLRAVLGVT